MDYTQSPDFETDALTGRRKHQDSKAVTTAVTADDMNMVIWSLMQVIEDAGLVGKGFDATNASTYTVLKEALRKTYRARDLALVTDHGALGDGETNDLPAVLTAKGYSTRLHFPRVDNRPTTYFLGPVLAGQLDGVSISADQGVTISLAAGAPYSLYKAITFESDVELFFRDVSRRYVARPTPRLYRKSAFSLPPSAVRRNRIAVDMTNAAAVVCRSVDWPTADTFNAEVSSVNLSSRSAAFSAVGSVTLRGTFIGLGAYETVSALFENGITPGPVGVVIRGTLGYTVVLSNGAAGNYTTGWKPLSGVADGPNNSLAWPQLGQGTY